MCQDSANHHIITYAAWVRRGGKLVHLGSFATAEEAGLCYARDIAANGPPLPIGMTAAPPVRRVGRSDVPSRKRLISKKWVGRAMRRVHFQLGAAMRSEHLGPPLRWSPPL